MSRELVLLTGATGHLGFRVLILALRAGYNVRAAVRNQENVDKILSAPSIQAIVPGSRLTFTFVPDIIAAGAYDEPLKDVKYVIHCASPITSGITEDFESKIIVPAVKGTTGILESAVKNPSVKRIVITSSVLGVIPFSEVGAQSGRVFDGLLKVPFNPGPYSSEFEAYSDSKVRALATTHDFVESRKPGFDVINLMPSFIIGKNELITKVEDFDKGTNITVFGQVLGAKGNPLPGTTVWLNDIATLHVEALDPKIPGNTSFVANSGGLDGTTFSDAIAVIAKKFPEAVRKGTLPNNGSQPTAKLIFDTTRTEEVFGIKFNDLEEQVTEIATEYLALVAQNA